MNSDFKYLADYSTSYQKEEMIEYLLGTMGGTGSILDIMKARVFLENMNKYSIGELEEKLNQKNTKQKTMKDEFCFESIPEKQNSMLNFIPSKELVDFAQHFSNKYKKIKPGIICDALKKYRIDYLNKPKENNYSNARFRISNYRGIIEVDRKWVLRRGSKIKKDFIFYMVIWHHACKWFVNSNRLLDYREVDSMVNKWYVTTGKSIKDIVVGWLDVFDDKSNITELNKSRYESSFKFFKKEKDNEKHISKRPSPKNNRKRNRKRKK